VDPPTPSHSASDRINRLRGICKWIRRLRLLRERVGRVGRAIGRVRRADVGRTVVTPSIPRISSAPISPASPSRCPSAADSSSAACSACSPLARRGRRPDYSRVHPQPTGLHRLSRSARPRACHPPVVEREAVVRVGVVRIVGRIERDPSVLVVRPVDRLGVGLERRVGRRQLRVGIDHRLEVHIVAVDLGVEPVERFGELCGLLGEVRSGLRDLGQCGGLLFGGGGDVFGFGGSLLRDRRGVVDHRDDLLSRGGLLFGRRGNLLDPHVGLLCEGLRSPRARERPPRPVHLRPRCRRSCLRPPRRTARFVLESPRADLLPRRPPRRRPRRAP